MMGPRFQRQSGSLWPSISKSVDLPLLMLWTFFVPVTTRGDKTLEDCSDHDVVECISLEGGT